MAGWADILADKTKYPDNATITINGAEVTLQAIREQNASTGGEIARKLDERERTVATREQNANAATDNLAKIVENVQRVTGLSVEQIVSGQIPENLRETVARATRSTQTDAGVALADDPLYQPVLRELQPIRETAELTKRALGQSLAVYQNDRARLDYMEWHQFKKPSGAKVDIGLDQAIQTAVSKGYKNDQGWPDIGRAMDELYSPAAAKTHDEEIRNAGIAEGRRQAEAEMAGRMNAPNFGGGFGGGSSVAGTEFSGKPETKPGATIREQLEKAFQDPNLLPTTAVQ